MDSAEIIKELLKSAKYKIDIDTFEMQGNDQLDFHELSASEIRSIMVMAFNLGRTYKN